MFCSVDFGEINPRLRKKMFKSIDFEIFFLASGIFFPNHPQKHVITITNSTFKNVEKFTKNGVSKTLPTKMFSFFLLTRYLLKMVIFLL